MRAAIGGIRSCSTNAAPRSPFRLAMTGGPRQRNADTSCLAIPVDLLSRLRCRKQVCQARTANLVAFLVGWLAGQFYEYLPNPLPTRIFSGHRFRQGFKGNGPLGPFFVSDSYPVLSTSACATHGASSTRFACVVTRRSTIPFTTRHRRTRPAAPRRTSSCALPARPVHQNPD